MLDWIQYLTAGSLVETFQNWWRDGGTWPQAAWDTIVSKVSSVGDVLQEAGAVVWKSIFYFLPDGGTLPDVFHTSAQYFGNTLMTVNFILPVDTLIYCMSLVLSVKLALFGFHIIRVIVSFTRGVGVDRYKF